MKIPVRKVVSFFSILAIFGLLAPASQAWAATRVPHTPTSIDSAVVGYTSNATTAR